MINADYCCKKCPLGHRKECPSDVSCHEMLGAEVKKLRRKNKRLKNRRKYIILVEPKYLPISAVIDDDD